MEDYKPNSHRSKEKAAAAAKTEKKVEKVVKQVDKSTPKPNKTSKSMFSNSNWEKNYYDDYV